MTTFTTLATALDVAKFSGSHVIVDCRSQIGKPEWGELEYRRAHIPNAYFAHLERDLSGEIIPGKTGRHPLPDPTKLSAFFSALGISPQTQVFAYDQDSGAYASRLWWLLRWLGHDAVAVIDGGLKAWIAAGLPTSDQIPSPRQGAFTGAPRNEKVIDAVGILERSADEVLIDARGANRFAGRDETVDPIAGHIPGARSLPFTSNLDAAGQFLDREALQSRFAPLSDQQVIAYCGSGVTACHNILAMVHAGLPEPRLYSGSWSEWICDSTRPIAIGE